MVKMMQKPEFTEEEYEQLTNLFDMLKRWHRKKGGYISSMPLEHALDKLAAVLQPTYKVKAAQVKELRELSGAGPFECKAILEETRGDVRLANQYLYNRFRGIPDDTPLKGATE